MGETVLEHLVELHSVHAHVVSDAVVRYGASVRCFVLQVLRESCGVEESGRRGEGTAHYRRRELWQGVKRGLMMMIMIREARIFIDGFGKEENLNVLLFIYFLNHSHFR